MRAYFQEACLVPVLPQFLVNKGYHLAGYGRRLLRIQKQEPRTAREHVLHRQRIFIAQRKPDHGLGQARTNPPVGAWQGLDQ